MTDCIQTARPRAGTLVADRGLKKRGRVDFAPGKRPAATFGNAPYAECRRIHQMLASSGLGFSCAQAEIRIWGEGSQEPSV